MNASSGYKTPSLYQLFSEYGNRALEPETSLNLEGGVQYLATSQKFTARASYFNRHIKDAIAFFFDPITFQSRYINQDEQKDHGFEAEVQARPSQYVQLRGIYNYVTGEITTVQNGKDTSYFNLLRRPKSTLNIFLGSQLTPALFVQANLNTVGERKDVYFDPVSFQARDITLDPYVLLNFYASYGLMKNRISLFIDLRNMLDKDYSDIYGYHTAGFNAYGGFRVKF